MAILIKRYANRKLYNTESSSYITLKGIAALLDAGEDIQVIDNETGEDITSVALSQILVDSKRSNTSPPETLVSQILGRSGDALYEALRKGVGDATEGFEEFQARVRNLMKPEEGSTQKSSTSPDAQNKSGGESSEDPFFFSAPDIEKHVQSAVERVFKMLDVPRRSDIDALNQNLERVASAIEVLEKALLHRRSATGTDDISDNQDPDVPSS